ncbi:16S rRNA (guanine(527)-N(7))-methyltransferase RsmG [Geomonas sp. RF6]|uniref:16S rRNA (guanine(527)-N(7))-methyltransferase RsmG n=1 Tax=Geomonas sp. RF6 TaxID=2897342 RepID=UPI001E60C956|nr:16S rRNA (guanine(527)-N(7))-methyltransferase RsmG [Geomonas sp. RF6]UFS72178.1 16S rRNA (guanine(527)-N(7))-methyltransferase RsmG [Geomonas sp. RF6]
MNAAAKKALLQGAAELGVTLSDAQAAAFDAFAEELKKWNKKINLTAIDDDAGIAVKHFVDSLTIFRALKPAGKLLDIGSGGGFPCIPVKIVAPEIEVLSVDAVVKKISFQKNAARLLNLERFTAQHVRAETLAADHAASFDWIVSRAFSDIPSFAAMALPLLKEDGKIIAMKGREGLKEAEAASGALAELGAKVVSVDEFALPIAGDARSLVVIARA